MKEKRLELTGFGLKRLAVVSMVIDHIGSFLLRAMMIPYMVEGTLTVNRQIISSNVPKTASPPAR